MRCIVWDSKVKLILHDRGTSAQPVKVMWCYKKELQTRMNELWQITEELYKRGVSKTSSFTNDPWKVDPEAMDAAIDEWDIIIAEYISGDTDGD